MFFKKQSHNDDLLAHSDPANAKRALGHYLNYGISYTFCEMLKIAHTWFGGTSGTAEQAIDMRIFANESYTQGAVKKFCLESW